MLNISPPEDDGCVMFCHEAYKYVMQKKLEEAVLNQDYELAAKIAKEIEMSLS